MSGGTDETSQRYLVCPIPASMGPRREFRQREGVAAAYQKSLKGGDMLAISLIQLFLVVAVSFLAGFCICALYIGGDGAPKPAEPSEQPTIIETEFNVEADRILEKGMEEAK